MNEQRSPYSGWVGPGDCRVESAKEESRRQPYPTLEQFWEAMQTRQRPVDVALQRAA